MLVSCKTWTCSATPWLCSTRPGANTVAGGQGLERRARNEDLEALKRLAVSFGRQNKKFGNVKLEDCQLSSYLPRKRCLLRAMIHPSATLRS